jgi:hypothetical protein
MGQLEALGNLITGSEQSEPAAHGAYSPRGFAGQAPNSSTLRVRKLDGFSLVLE